MLTLVSASLLLYFGGGLKPSASALPESLLYTSTPAPIATTNPPPLTSNEPEAGLWAEYAHLSYCLPDNINRYIQYQQENDDLPPEKCMAYVNVNLDLGFFCDVVEIDQPEDLMVLCNKNFTLPIDYVPDDLVEVSQGSGQVLRAVTAAAFTAMRDAMALEKLTITLRSAYRSYETQKYTYEAIVQQEINRLGLEEAGRASADRVSARPGMSEHQAGLAIDITQPVSGGKLSAAQFENTKQYQWLLENAHDFGFILRYPDGYEHITGYRFEPWHWRYVGVEAATRMREEDITTFEEYRGKYLPPRAQKR